MFGESDSESPRVPSPWDSLTSTSPQQNETREIPKLVPEAEEGNVEYKLQLLSPSPARFARLVTQLKWRLLEGGGQAYYELGVADSGTLVGLPRQQLEESLETLEMMANEISASVIIVKEIEVPPELSSVAESQLERWDGKKSTRRRDLLRMMKQDASPPTSATEFETELSTADFTDAEESTCYSPTTPASLGEESKSAHFTPSPILLPFDPPPAIFAMDVGEDVANYADNEGPDDDIPTNSPAKFSFSLEVVSVYKPRTMKTHVTHIASPLSTHPEYVKKRHKNGYPPSESIDTIFHTGHSSAQDSFETVTQPLGAIAQFRGDKRHKRRESRLNARLTQVPTRRSTESLTDSADHHTIPSCSSDESNSSTLGPLHNIVVDRPTGDASGTTTVASKDPRLIVEVLVVRKLSLDEAFLDFEGFSLQ